LAVCWLIVEPPRSRPPSLFASSASRIAVEAVVAAEIAVLGGDHRARHVWVDAVEVAPAVGDAVAFERVAQHQRGGRRIDVFVRDHPQHRDQEDQRGEDQRPAQHEAQCAAAGPSLRTGERHGAEAIPGR
jgi:hypothetical protein